MANETDWKAITLAVRSQADPGILSLSQAVIETFLDELWSINGLSDNTLNAYRTDLSLLACFLARERIELTLADKHDLRRYLSWRKDKGFAKSSSARVLSAMRRFLWYLIEKAMIQVDPCVSSARPNWDRNCREPCQSRTSSGCWLSRTRKMRSSAGSGYA